MAYIHAIAAGNLEWVLQAAALRVSVLREDLLLYLRRGFGRGGAYAFFNSRRGR
jgi:hypothetical protein